MRHRISRVWPISLLLVSAVFLTNCSNTPPSSSTSGEPVPANAKLAALARATAGQFQPVPLPDPHIDSFKFPEAENTIVGWTTADNRKAMDLHAWGIWTALNQVSDQVFNGQKLRVFETWYSPDDILSPGATPPTGAGQRLRNPRPLEVPRQLQHGAAENLTAAGPHGDATVRAFVKFDPSASDFIVTNDLLSKAQLNKYLNTDHKTAVPDLPSTSISLKSIYTPLPAAQLVSGRYFRLRSWPGPPALTFDQTSQMWLSKAFPPQSWGQCIWIDVQGSGNTGAGVDKTCSKDGSSRTPASTYGVDQFVNYRMTKADADLMNALTKRSPSAVTADATEGDYAVLVAMHVTSRETTRWTWQTFWWTNAPDNPTAPSSSAIALARPAQLTGPPRHYAQCTAYDEVRPPQPNTGGSNAGDSVYCFNPYLEAGFSATDLPTSLPGMTMLNGKAVKTANNVGVQTNCMSCHEMAKFPSDHAPYTGSRYVDLNDPTFKGFLKVDFLWSLSDLAQ